MKTYHYTFTIFLLIAGLKSICAQETALETLDYLKCACHTGDITKRITETYKLSENHDCINCSHRQDLPIDITNRSFPNKEAMEYFYSLDPEESVNSNCILASNQYGRAIDRKKMEFTKQKSPGSFRVCNESRSNYYEKDKYLAKSCKPQSWQYADGYCPNKEYVEMTTRALNEVANCLELPPKSLFPLYNHESRFILNNRSPTGALCYGQMTAGTVEMINNYSNLNYKYYSSGNSNALREEAVDSLRLDKILESPKCVMVKSKFKKLDTKRVRGRNGEYVKYDGRNSNCDIIENPYTCLMYSVLNHKLNFEYAKQIMKSAFVYVSTNQKEGKQLIHKDKETLARFENKMSNSPTYGYLEYEARPIFENPEQVQEIATLYAYNGGIATITVLFDDFVSLLRRELDNSRNIKLRESFFDGGLDTKYFVNRFTSYIRAHYPSKSANRRGEVADFVSKIKNDLHGAATGKSNLSILQCADARSFITLGNF